MKKFLIKLLGGFSDVESVLEHIRSINDKSEKHKILTEAVKHLYNAIGPEDILHQEGDLIVFEGKPIHMSDYNQIREEAAVLTKMKVWRIIKRDIQYRLNERMFLEGKFEDDLVWGKLIQFLDDIIRKRLQTLK